MAVVAGGARARLRGRRGAAARRHARPAAGSGRKAEAAETAETSVRNTSRYRGVSWHKQKSKWVAQIGIDGSTKHLGFFESEEDAARAYDAEARSLGRAVNFRLLDTDRTVEEEEEQAEARAARAAETSKAVGRTSRYRGVYWDKQKSKWVAQITIDGKVKHLGRFDSEEDAARAYDAEARSLGRDVNFRLLDTDRTVEEKEAQAEASAARAAETAEAVGRTSRYRGVSWAARDSKWQASISIDGRRKYLGYFESEDDAARAYDAEARSLGRTTLNFPR